MTRDKTGNFLRALADQGKAILISSHILTELADVCTSVAILERGRLVVHGPIHEISRRLQSAAPPQQPLMPGDPRLPDAPPGMGPPVMAPQAPAQPTHAVKLKVLAPGEAVHAMLIGWPSVQRVGPGPGGSVIVTYFGDDQALAQIVRGLVVGGIPVVGVEPERSELERIFLEVTKGEVQ